MCSLPPDKSIFKLTLRSPIQTEASLRFHHPFNLPWFVFVLPPCESLFELGCSFCRLPPPTEYDLCLSSSPPILGLWLNLKLVSNIIMMPFPLDSLPTSWLTSPSLLSLAAAAASYPSLQRHTNVEREKTHLPYEPSKPPLH